MGKGILVLYRQKDIFLSRRKDIEVAVEKLNKIGTVFCINESYFLYDKSNFIDQTFIK